MTNAGAFNIWPDQYLEANPFSFMGQGSPFQANENLGFAGASILGGQAPEVYSAMGYHTLFITCSLGTHGDTVGPIGQSSLARKVVIDQGYGSFVNDYHSLPYDFLALEPQAVTGIRISVVDWRGRPVEMSHWSLSIIVIPEENF